MSKPKLVITRSLIPEAQSLLSASSLEIIQWDSSAPCPRPWLLDHIRGATAALVMLSDQINTELLDAAGPSLKAIASFSVGTDHIDKPALAARGIRLGYTPTCLTDAVADLTVMLTLMAQRRAAEALRDVVLAGSWADSPWHPGMLTGPGLRGATVGFLGFGRIAQAAALRMLPFGVARVVYVTSRPGEAAREDHFGLLGRGDVRVADGGADEVARECDVVVVACALTDETKHLVGKDFFAAMKRTGVLVNIARGPVVDTAALVEALETETIFGAGLDVIEGEPNIGADHPLLKQKRAVLLPHIGSATLQARRDMAIESVKNVLAGIEGGEMVNEVAL
jgi:glyoxylate/hydroxypyruvate reductase